MEGGVNTLPVGKDASYAYGMGSAGMTYSASLSQDEQDFIKAHDRVMAKQWDGMERRRKIRGIIRNPYKRVTVVHPKVREMA